MKEANPPTAMTINIEYRNTISSSGTIIALPLPTINSKHMKDMYLLFQENPTLEIVFANFMIF